MCRSVDVKQAVLAKNDDLAAALRADLAGRGVAVVNLLSSPGSGKTELLCRVLAHAVATGVPVAALTADLATENDARRLARSGAPVRQVLTDGLCHLEARQVRGHLEDWLPADTEVLFVENVGNLVCPASYDLGETLRIVLMAVTEGEDKPLKYPTAFGSAHLVVLTKTDLAAPAGFDEDAFTANVRRVNPGVEIVRSCARTGDGAAAVLDRALAARDGAPQHHPPLAPRPHSHDLDGAHGDAPGHTHNHPHPASVPAS
ncbi:hydrogenase nickel incorporation protein HypB [Streptomyces anandii]|uniref:Hydrogenase nickel incorporation protein HypB n=1 Tax=Streptomyces anandii TaxID=285454 RepID=A0ABW6HGW8_9ACTN